MKILFILHLPPPVHGPAVIGEHIKQSSIINSGFECSYLNLGISSSLDDIGAKSYSKFFRFLTLIWNVKKQLILNRPDLCYITLNSKGSGFYKDSLIALIVKFFRVKRIYHFHNKGITDHKKNYFENLLYKLVFRNTDVILISERLYYDFEEYVPQDKVHYCTNGIPEKMNSATGDRRPATGYLNPDPGPRTQDPTTNKVCNLLFLSNLFESKGTIILLEACKILKERNLKFHCTFSGAEGDITQAQFLSKVNNLDLVDCISYEGMKLNKEKEDVFSNADIFVHPSYFDCLPLVILEAMQHSLPVVSTMEGAIPDAVEDGVSGFLVPVKDPVALAGKLEMLINDPDLRTKMGEEGWRRFERKFRLEFFEIRLVEILREAAKKELAAS